MNDLYILLPILILPFLVKFLTKFTLWFCENMAKAMSEFERKVDYYKGENKND